MAYNSPYDIGSKNWTPLIVKPLLTAVASGAIAKVRGQFDKTIQSGRLQGSSFGMVQSGSQFVSSLVMETIHMYAYPEISSTSQLALNTLSAVSSACVSGGINVLLLNQLIPELSGSISPLELFLQGVGSDIVASYASEKAIYPILANM